MILYFAFSLPQFAYAADVDSILPEDHNHIRLLGTPLLDVDFEDVELREVGYEAHFLGNDRGIIGRVPTANTPTSLGNNQPRADNITPGVLNSYSFLNSSWGTPSTSTSDLPSTINRRWLSASGDQGDRDEEEEEEEMDWGLRLDAEEGLKLRPRQTVSNPRLLYISVNVCSQPTTNNSVTPDQLDLYISQSESNTNPGPSADASTQTMYTLEGGYAMVALNATGNVFFGLYGKNSSDYSGVWNAQVAASYDAPYHYYINESFLVLVDSDSSSALLITNSLTTAPPNSTEFMHWTTTAPPFTMFASKTGNASILGVQNSYCGLQQYADVRGTVNGDLTDQVQTVITTKGADIYPKEQLYIDGLSAASSYYGILAINGNSTDNGAGVIGGGGQVFRMMTFNTISSMYSSSDFPSSKTDTLLAENCAVIFNLSFCDQVAWAVPANSNNFPNASALGNFYDENVKSNFAIFEKILALIPCETTSSAQYSLAQNCTSCYNYYKDWLCTVSMPRCTDFDSTLPWLQERGMGQTFPNGTLLSPALVQLANQTMAINNSRNPNIDEFVQPGPYKEILPCDDLCYDIVKACPASMGFDCPTPEMLGFNQSYGKRPTSAQSGNVTCSYPGAAHFLSAGGRSSVSLLILAVAIALSLVFI